MTVPVIRDGHGFCERTKCLRTNHFFVKNCANQKKRRMGIWTNDFNEQSFSDKTNKIYVKLTIFLRKKLTINGSFTKINERNEKKTKRAHL